METAQVLWSRMHSFRSTNFNLGGITRLQFDLSVTEWNLRLNDFIRQQVSHWFHPSFRPSSFPTSNIRCLSLLIAHYNFIVVGL